MTEELKKELGARVKCALFDEPMKRHTTFRAGGPAAAFLVPTEAELKEVYPFLVAEAVPVCILGNGSNVLFSDRGFDGAVIEIGKAMGTVRVDGTHVTAGAGSLLSVLAKAACDHSLTGLEFASGIPGSVGGAVFMNAGAYGGEVKDVIESVRALRADGSEVTYSAEELGLAYRRSRFSEEGCGEIILEADFVLRQGNEDEIRATMADLNGRRREKQPLEYPSAGSTFKRPEGYFAGKLISDAGLKGLAVGGAQVSEKHAGFIINTGDASAADIYSLIREVQKRVREASGVELVPEVRLIGDFD